MEKTTTGVISQETIERGHRLRQIRNMLGMTIEEFGAFCGKGESTIRQWEQGRASGLSHKGAHSIISKLHGSNVSCNVDWLYSGEEEPPKYVDATVANLPFLNMMSNKSEADRIQQEMTVFKHHAQDAITWMLTDNSMEPMYHPQDYVGGIQYRDENMRQLDSKICLVKLADGETLLRKVKLNEHGNYDLFALNPDTTAKNIALLNVKLQSAAPVSRVWRIA